MVIERCGFKELHRAFRITRRGVYFSGKGKSVKDVPEGKPKARSLRGARYENASSHWGITRNQAI